MLYLNTIAYIGLFITIIALIIMNIVQILNYNEETRIYRKKPLKEYLFPPVLPIHRSPSYKPKFTAGRYSKSMPVINV
jgi:hypothetical protein